MEKQNKKKKSSATLEMNRLAVVLKEEKITNRSLASMLGYEEATVSKWMTNTKQPPLSTFLRIALIINRDLKDLFISTTTITEKDKAEALKLLSKIAETAKRTGKNKAKN